MLSITAALGRNPLRGNAIISKWHEIFSPPLGTRVKPLTPADRHHGHCSVLQAFKKNRGENQNGLATNLRPNEQQVDLHMVGGHSGRGHAGGLGLFTHEGPHCGRCRLGRQLPFFSVLVPFWLIGAVSGRKGMMEAWPAILVAGVSFAIPQYLVSNFIGPELVDSIAAIVSMACLVGFVRFWQPKKIWTSASRCAAKT